MKFLILMGCVVGLLGLVGLVMFLSDRASQRKLDKIANTINPFTGKLYGKGHFGLSPEGIIWVKENLARERADKAVELLFELNKDEILRRWGKRT